MIFSERTTLVVQCFNKPDTIAKLLESIRACNHAKECHLIVYQDGITDQQSLKYGNKHDEVRKVIKNSEQDLIRNFRSVEIFFSEVNRGTCGACMDAIDLAMSQSENVIFTEDDTVFARDALSWFGFALNQIRLEERVIAAAGESIFFDSREETAQPEPISNYQDFVDFHHLQSAFTHFPFIPSTCFAVNRSGWELIGKTRGQPRGDEDVCDLVKQIDLLCIFPIVARVSDLGMLHPDGFSVSIHGVTNVKEKKNVFLTSDMVDDVSTAWFRFSDDADDLFRATVSFSKTVDQISTKHKKKIMMSGPFISTNGATKLWCFSLKNFGDALTPYILNRFGIKFEIVDQFDDAELIGIGSNLDRVYGAKNIRGVWTSGFMYPKSQALRFHKDLEIFGVRGFQTAASILDLPESHSLGDGGLLVRNLYAAKSSNDGRIGLIPHMSDKSSEAIKRASNDSRFKIIDVFSEIDDILMEVQSARFVLSTSLHGLIVADALGVPNAFAKLRDGRALEGDGFKYDDYISATGGELSEIDMADLEQVIASVELATADYFRPNLDECLDQLGKSVMKLKDF